MKGKTMTADRRDFLKKTALLTLGAALPNVLDSASAKYAGTKPLPDVSWRKLPRWRGFNLLEKFNGRNTRFLEDDFRMISDLGFNFVRLPMDYRMWITDGDWRKFDEKTLREIDEAIAWGEKYGIHTMVNFHRAPGYTVAKPQEEKLVWESEEALDVCALHWRTFAKRYAGIPEKNLSFNLFNEPSNVELAPFMKVHRTLCDAIRAEDPKRLIICDGLSWGTKPTMELAELQVAQATRGYMPMEISHYRASWVGEYLRDMKDPPQWPSVLATGGTIFYPGKAGIREEQKSPTIFRLAPQCGTGLFRIRIRQVSSFARFVAEAVNADGKVTSTLFDREYRPGPGTGDWTEVIHKPEWNCFQNIYHKDETFSVPAGTAAVQLRVTSGDWLSIEEAGFRCDAVPQETVQKISSDWNSPAMEMAFCIQNGRGFWDGLEKRDAKWHWKNYVEPWKQWERFGGVMVGEFGAYNQTPHETVLAWLRDLMSNWKKAGWGWAMWNFRGSLGVMESGRSDVQYVNWHGLKMDRKMMDLLQEF